MEQREIKVKAWNPQTSEMMDSISIQDLACRPALNPTNIHRLIFLEYTGLKDKNDKEIYKGDILLMDSGHKVKVEWNQQQGQYWLISESMDTMDIMGFPEPLGNGYLKRRDSKIIGNIYENPELLK